MIPNRISLKGFLSYRDEVTFLFDDSPLWILTGDNGSGKSTVFDAIRFALYDEHRGGKQLPERLVNHFCDQAIMELDFQIDNSLYQIRRVINKKGSPKKLYSAYILLPKDDGSYAKKPIPNTDNQDGFQTWRDELVGLSYEAFVSSVMLLQGEGDAIIHMKPTARHELLATLIDLGRYQKLYELANDRFKSARDAEKWAKDQLEQIDATSITEAAIANAEDNVKEAQHAREVSQKRGMISISSYHKQSAMSTFIVIIKIRLKN